MKEAVSSVFDDLGVGITIHDPETGGIVGVNDRLTELYGYSEAELLGMDVHEYSAVDEGYTQAKAEERIRAAVDGEPQEFEWRIERSDGQRCWVSVRTALTTLDGEEYVIAEIRDITERKEREQELKIKDQAIEQAPVGVTMTDPTQQDNPLVYANSTFTDLVGYTESEIMGWNHRRLQGDATSEAAVDELRTAIDNEVSTTVQLRNYTKDGTMFWNRVSLAPLYDDAGTLTNWVGFQQDVTDRKTREEELAELNTATRKLARATTSQEVADIACETAEDVLGFSMNAVNFYDESEGGLTPVAVSEAVEDLLDTVPVLDSGLAWDAYQDGEACIHGDLGTADDAYNPETEFRSEMFVPFGDHGVLIIGSTEPDAFGETDLRLAEILGATIESTLDRTEQRQQLEAEKAFIEKSLDTIEDAFYLLDPNGNLERWNTAVNEVTGYTDEEISGMHAMDFFADDDAEEIADTIAEILETGSAVVEAEYVTKDGEGIPYEFTGSRFTDEEGELIGIIGIGRDIAERQEQLERLEKQERAFRKLHQTASKSVSFEEKIADLLAFGREFMGVEQGFLTRIDGDTQEIVVGVGPNEQLQDGADAPFSESYCRHTVDPDRDGPLTVMNAAEEGWKDDPAYERFGLACYAGSEITVDGETRGTICFADRNPVDKEFTEIQETFVELLTEWASYELERAEREEKYRRLTERISDAYYAIDTDFNITFWNDVIAERVGVPAETVVGENFWDHFPEVEGTVVEERLREAMETGEPTTCEFYYEKHDYWTQLQIYPDEDGLAVISKDITERKEYEQQLERSNERLQEFAYILSHDLQEPLRMVSSYVCLLEEELDEHLDEETQQYIDFAVDGAERMRGMIDGLLLYSRVETEGGEFDETDVDSVLTAVRQDLELKLDDASADLVVDDLPTVQADEDQLVQLFENLIKNAIEHGGEGTTVEVSATEVSDGYRFAVTDDGPGIPTEKQDDIFGLFDKGSDSDGTGMGLAICQRIVNRHDGDIWVDSEPGEGATFYVTLNAA